MSFEKRSDFPNFPGAPFKDLPKAAPQSKEDALAEILGGIFNALHVIAYCKLAETRDLLNETEKKDLSEMIELDSE